MAFSYNRSIIFSAMREGAAIVTPNNRLAHQLLEDFLVASEKDLSIKPTCLPYLSFLQTSYQQIRHKQPEISHPLLLTSSQQRYLWQHILKENGGDLHWLSDIQEAWRRCHAWQLSSDEPAFLSTPQTALFHSWCVHFESRLTALNAITTEQLPNYLLPYLNQLAWKSIFWVSFDEYSPQQQTFQNTLAETNIQQHHYDLAPKSVSAHQFAAQHDDEEYSTLLHWLEKKLALGEKRIAVVIPNLETEASKVVRKLQTKLSGHQFNLSLGESLLSYPLIAHALQWLSLLPEQVSYHQACLLLHSPYVGGAKMECLTRAEALQSLSPQQSTIPMRVLLQISPPLLQQHLSAISPYPPSASPREWVHLFQNRLSQLGFPGDYPLDSAAYQCFDRLIQLFDEFQAITLVAPILSQEAAIQLFLDLARTTIFQAKKTAAPVQILGWLEASGCVFDSVWVTGLTDQCLPQKTSFSPWIPLSLQREKRMPRALAERELQFATQGIERLQYGCNDIVFSYSRLLGDLPQLASPLIVDFPAMTYLEKIVDDKITLVEYEEKYQFPLIEEEKAFGGTTLLANQAKCPFRAFAAHRLNALSQTSFSEGLDARARGQMIHLIMENIWRDLQNQSNLLALTPTEETNLISASIEAAFATLLKDDASVTPLVLEVEYLRLKALIEAALAVDKSRPSFEIDALEQAFEVQLAGIDFRVRVDRVDRLANQTKAIIDYKSRLPATKPWREARPESPQLLLYALLDEAIQLLLFLELKTGHAHYNGFSAEKVDISGVTGLKGQETWEGLRESWQQSLEALAIEFREGQCTPSPQHASTCEHCEFQNLCRLA